ncbi:hypothetical protein LCGC14_1624070, partial [marine sediment metagenome]
MGKPTLPKDRTDLLKEMLKVNDQNYGLLRAQDQMANKNIGAGFGAARNQPNDLQRFDIRGGFIQGWSGSAVVTSDELDGTGIINLQIYQTSKLIIPNVGANTLLVLVATILDGQELWISAESGDTLPIQNTAGAGNTTTGNIDVGGSDITLNAGDWLQLVFDARDQKWHGSLGTGGGSEGSRLLTGLTADDSTVGVIPWDNNFFFGDITKITATATPGVFKLLQGDSYTMEALLQVEMVESGGGSELTFTWQEGAAEGGPFTDVAANQSVVGSMEVGKATLTTQPHAIALVVANTADVFVRTFSTLLSGTYTRTIALSTIAEIETIGTGSAGGTGGADSLGQLSDVAINPDPPIANDILQFNTTSG